jgi:hypothetical protein
MMNVAKPITPKEYEDFRAELYEIVEGKESSTRFAVALDSDPSLRPKGINEKLSVVQGNKDRLMVIYNRAILNESYWKTKLKQAESKYEAEFQRAMLSDEAKTGKNGEIRNATATSMASASVVQSLFSGEGVYEDNMAKVSIRLADAIAFFKSVQNIYDNLNSTDMNLARQLKSIMVNTKVYGDHADTPEGALSVEA